MAPETIRISKQARDQLVRLKRLTRVGQWNILCRWAFCLSLAEPSPPRIQRIPADGNVEMSWRTFAGHHESIYLALVCQRCRLDGVQINEKTVAEQFRLHLHRGIGYLAGDPQVKSIAGLVRKATAGIVD